MHAVTIRPDGRAEMAYRGEKPWHGLGNELFADATMEDWRDGSGMDFTVIGSPVSYLVDDEIYTMQDRMVLRRSDNKLPLGIVSVDYEIVQPGEVLTFFDDLIHTLGLQLETAGTLFGGRRFWALAKIGEQALLDHYRMKGYLLLSTSADGSRKTTAKFTAVRVVCNNTLTMAHAAASTGGEVGISHSVKFNPARVKEQLGVVPKTFDNFMASIKRLSAKRMPMATAKKFTADLLGEESSKIVKVMQKFDGAALGFDEPGFRGTAWGWLNSLTETLDHGGYSKSDSHRLDNNIFGVSDKLKTKAFNRALEYAGA